MARSYSYAKLARGGSVGAALALGGVLLWYLPQPGYSRSRLVLFALIGAAAALGAVGSVAGRPGVTLTAAVGLFLLGFWQAVLSVFIYPVVALFLLTATLDRNDHPDSSETHP